MKQPELTTERLLLRGFKLDDADEVYILAKNFNLSKTTLNIPYPYVTGMAEEWIGSHNEIWKTESGVVYAITMLETDRKSMGSETHNKRLPSGKVPATK